MSGVERAHTSGRQRRWYLGVDAGATRCRVRLRDALGAVSAEAEGPAANAYVDFAGAVKVARETVMSALAREAQIDTSCVRVVLGVAGIGSRAEAQRFAALLPGFASIEVVNDAVAACVGAHAGRDGGLIVVGTGSAGVASVGGLHTIVGGRGFHLGDDGSAARLGLEAARATARAADGLGPQTRLTEQIHAQFDNDALAMVTWAAKATPGEFGAFAPLVLEAARAGDAAGLRLVAEASAAVTALVQRVEALGASRVAMVGGLGEALRPFLDAGVSARLKAPLFDPTDGAILLAGGVVEETPA